MAQMKAKDEIENALLRVDSGARSKYPGMTYEQGVEEALQWVLGEISDDEFGYGKGL